MDTAHWPQGIGVVRAPMEGSKQPINNTNTATNNCNNMLDQRRARPQKDQALNCPRCNSTNTKFCYYNNYSLTQPRYFCKTCRRYWTEGGSLRNVPVGGGSRKNKRSSSSTSTSTSTTTSSISSPPPSLSNKKLIHDHLHQPTMISPSLLPPSLNFPHHHHHDHHDHQSASQNPKLIHQGQDLNLAYPPTADHLDHHHHHNMSRISFLHHDHQAPYSTSSIGINPSSTSTTTNASTTSSSASSSQHVSAMELLKTGMAPRGGLSSFIAMPVHVPDHRHSNSATTMFSSSLPTGFPNLGGGHEFKPSLSFGLDQYDHESGYNNGNLNGVQETSSARLLFPSDQDLKQVSNTPTTTHDHHDSHDGHQFEQINRGQGDNSASGYNWGGMLGGGSW